MVFGIDFSRSLMPERTGVEWYSYYLFLEFQKIARAHPEERFFFYFRDEIPNGVPANCEARQVESINVKGRAWLWTQLGLSVELLKEHPDVLFVPSHALPLICPGKAVITIHDIGFLRHPEWYSRLGRVYHKMSLRFAAKHAAKIIVPSEFTKKELLELTNIKPSKIEVTHLGYDPLRYHSGLEEVKIEQTLAKYNLRRNRYLLNVGRREEKKNLFKLLKAFCVDELSCVDLDLVFIGPKGFNYEKIETMLPRPNVRELEYVPESDLPYIYAGARALVMPSLYEGFGLPPLQAMAVGTPVLISSAGSLPEICGEAAVVVDPGDEKDITRGIMEILDEQRAATLRAQGLERAKQFSWEKCARETFNVLKGL